MKRVTINAYQTDLVFKNGVYVRLLTEGRHWLSFKETVITYEKDKPFSFVVELNVLLKDPALADALHVVEVRDNAIALVYENGLLAKVLTSGRYALLERHSDLRVRTCRYQQDRDHGEYQPGRIAKSACRSLRSDAKSGSP